MLATDLYTSGYHLSAIDKTAISLPLQCISFFLAACGLRKVFFVGIKKATKTTGTPKGVTKR
jgi:hypothetical protein